MKAKQKKNKPKVRPIKLSEEKLKDLQDFINSNVTRVQKKDMIKKVTGGTWCLRCEGIPSKILVYDYDGAQRIERYWMNICQGVNNWVL